MWSSSPHRICRLMARRIAVAAGTAKCFWSHGEQERVVRQACVLRVVHGRMPESAGAMPAGNSVRFFSETVGVPTPPGAMPAGLTTWMSCPKTGNPIPGCSGARKISAPRAIIMNGQRLPNRQMNFKFRLLGKPLLHPNPRLADSLRPGRQPTSDHHLNTER